MIAFEKNKKDILRTLQGGGLNIQKLQYDAKEKKVAFKKVKKDIYKDVTRRGPKYEVFTASGRNGWIR